MVLLYQQRGGREGWLLHLLPWQLRYIVIDYNYLDLVVIILSVSGRDSE